METRPIDPLERVAALERWESNAKHNRRRATWSAWISVLAAAVVLAGLIYFGHRELAETRAAVGAESEKLDALKAKNKELEQSNNELEKRTQALGNLVGSVSEKVGNTKVRAAVEQTLTQNPQAASLLPRVYLQIVDQNDRDYAKYMGKKLKEAGFIVLGVEYRTEAYRPDARGISMTDVRYYKKVDEPGAQKVLDVLKKAGEDPVKLIIWGWRMIPMCAPIIMKCGLQPTAAPR